MCCRYTHGKLVEINSHSLFSKWFSESGKLVQRLFSMVTEMVDDEDGFVVILIGACGRAMTCEAPLTPELYQTRWRV